MSPTLPAAATIRITRSGPYLVSGSLPLAKQALDANAEGDSVGWKQGKQYPLQPKYALCRCGHSANKPFCDATHAKVGFDGTETASREPYRDQAKIIRGPTRTLTDVASLCISGRCSGSLWRRSFPISKRRVWDRFRVAAGRSSWTA